MRRTSLAVYEVRKIRLAVANFILFIILFLKTKGELRGCQADVMNMVKYIKDVHGFTEDNITLLLDDGEHTPPTKENILHAYRTLVKEAQPGDAVFCHYSGHGGKVRVCCVCVCMSGPSSRKV